MYFKKRLMTPGPTMVEDSMRLRLARPMLHHRNPEFCEAFKRFSANLQKIFCSDEPVVTFLASGTGAMEAAVANFFGRGEKVLVIVTGLFGERFVEIARAHGLETVEYRLEFGRMARAAELARMLDADSSIRGVFATFVDTSTGVMNDIRSLAGVTRNRDVLLVVDGVSGIATAEYRHSEWGVDVCVTASQKGMAGPPGLSFLASSRRALDKARRLREARSRTVYYFDVIKMLDFLPKGQTPYTPAISIISGMIDRVEYLANNLDEFLRERKFIADALRHALISMGLELFAEEGARSNSVTNVRPPEGIAPRQIVDIMRDIFGVAVACGQERMEKLCFRLGTMGDVDFMDLMSMLAALELTLHRLGRKEFLGRGTAALLNYFAERNR